MQIVLLYVVTAVIFLGIDALGLRLIMRPLFERHLGDALLEGLRMTPAALFYMFYVGVLLFFVSWPALRDGSGLGRVFLQGLLFGAVTYGTYEFTSYAVMKDWHWSMVATDLTWGTGLTAVSATLGLGIARAIT